MCVQYSTDIRHKPPAIRSHNHVNRLVFAHTPPILFLPIRYCTYNITCLFWIKHNNITRQVIFYEGSFQQARRVHIRDIKSIGGTEPPHNLSISFALTHTHSHSLIHTHTHSHSLTHSHTHSLIHSLTHSPTHSLPSLLSRTQKKQKNVIFQLNKKKERNLF